MNTIIQTTLSRYLPALSFCALAGCSTLDSYQIPSQPTAPNLPQIPEIIRQQVSKTKPVVPQAERAQTPQVIIRQYPQQAVGISTIPQITKQAIFEEQQRLLQQAKQNATVDIDPYAAIPDDGSHKQSNQQALSIAPTSTISTTRSTSPAVRSLIVSAQADLTLGRSQSAMSKLERGLRIEPEDAQLWHMLAKAHYTHSAFSHAISIAKKSNTLAKNNDLIAENWKLIKHAGERSGNTSVIKEALDYTKLNP